MPTSLGPHLFIQVPQAVIEEAAGEATEAQVGAEARGAGQQGVGVHAGSLVVGNPGLQQKRGEERKGLDVRDKNRGTRWLRKLPQITEQKAKEPGLVHDARFTPSCWQNFRWNHH